LQKINIILILNKAIFNHLTTLTMPKYVIERETPGSGNLSKEEQQAISQKSCSVLENMGPHIQWVESYVTGDKIYCVYIAPGKDMILEHAQKAGIPANSVSEVKFMLDPTTAEMVV
jgi:hypothetical protein